MTGKTPDRKRPAPRVEHRADRYAARSVLREESSLYRVRQCGLHATPRVGELGYVTVSVADTPDGARASLGGLSVCGNTWSCPCCSERIQTERNAEVRHALATARELGWMVAFVTLTVRHRRSHALENVWAAVAGAWRAATSGAGPTWEAERDHYGVEGYLRLSETTYGEANGWHSHIHALLFLNPAGRLQRVTQPLVGPLRAPKSKPVPLELRSVIPAGPPTFADAKSNAENVKQRMCPWTPPVVETTDGRWVGGDDPRPKVDAYASNGEPLSYRVGATQSATEETRCMAALINDAHAENRRRRTRSGNPAVREPALVDHAAMRSGESGLRPLDAVHLANSMFTRWRNHLAGLRCTDDGEHCTRRDCQRARAKGAPACGAKLGYEPDAEHGLDVRIVNDDGRFLADYFAKNRYGLKTEASAAYDVTGSHSKQAKRGNLTPFGLLERIATAPEAVDETTGLITRARNRRDLAIWQEWERASKGRRQLLWSNGLRALLGLDVERTDEEIAAAPEGVEVLCISPAGYRRLERAAQVPKLLAMVEAGDLAAARYWLHGIGVHTWRPGEDPPEAEAA